MANKTGVIREEALASYPELATIPFESEHMFSASLNDISGTITAQLVHIGAMYTPWIKYVLNIQPVSPGHWLELLVLAFSVLIAMELHKLVWNRFHR